MPIRLLRIFFPNMNLSAKVRLVSIILMLLTAVSAFAQSESLLLFDWQGKLYAQSIEGTFLKLLGEGFGEFADAALPGPEYDIYNIQASVIENADPEYGFYHGVWTANFDRFTHLEIHQSGLGYRIYSGNNATPNLLYEGRTNNVVGILDPLGWNRAGELLLIERSFTNLDQIDELKLWKLSPFTNVLSALEAPDVPPLVGRSMLLRNGRNALIGINLTRAQGYILNLDTLAVSTFNLLTEVSPPRTPFHTHGIRLVGMISPPKLADYEKRLAQENTLNDGSGIEPNYKPSPFLYWPLPDDQREIACYPDTEWTVDTYGYTCPHYISPFNYFGHEGTDVGMRPDGLEIGTPVYPAASGIVKHIFTLCFPDSPSCNGAYGNTIIIRHVFIKNDNLRFWDTGYAHLQRVLVEEGDTIDKLNQPIALSGATGNGGAHLHFEVRTPTAPTTHRTVNPWDGRYTANGTNLWVLAEDRPVSAESLTN